ncbi:MAG: hypothetical protein R3F46_01250 [bacterium]
MYRISESSDLYQKLLAEIEEAGCPDCLLRLETLLHAIQQNPEWPEIPGREPARLARTKEFPCFAGKRCILRLAFTILPDFCIRLDAVALSRLD